ncbi:MAG: flagellar filament capping protein FliD [Sedimentisphaerales bacterium]|nr:flagellar filament capping protein FliD [Sedimentisphaerales bacterium]
MGTIQLPGLSTGINTSTLISQLMQVEQRPLQQYKTRQSTWNERKTALSAIESKLMTLRSAAQALADAQKLRAYSTVSSDKDILTAESSDNAFEGNHTVTVNQLANAERWVHTAGKEYAEDTVTAGTFIYSCNHQETIITTTDETTLEEMVGLINNDANNPGVTANLLYYNDAYHLVLNGNEAGSDYEIQIHASNTEVWQAASPLTAGSEGAALADKIVSLDQFDGTLVGDEYIKISGTLHDGTEVSQNVAITKNTTLNHVIEEINDLFAGTATATLVNGQIRLTDHTSGTSFMELDLDYNVGSGETTFEIPAISQLTRGGSTPATLTGFAAADFIETQSAQDSQIKVDGYPPGDDNWITRSSNTVDNVIQGVTLHLHDAGTAQVNLTRDVASVKTKLDALVGAYNAAVALIKEKTGYNETLKTAGLLMGDSVVSSIANDVRLPFVQQTSGFVVDVDSFLMPAQIGLELDGDGQISLDSGAFNDAIVEDYMGALAVVGANKTGSSNSNTIGFYGASSKYTAAGTYSVEVTVADGKITVARIKLSSDATYRNATIDGNIITGNSAFDSDGRPANPENGLQLSVDLSQDGTFAATVRVKQGFAGALADTLDRVLKASTGTLDLDLSQATDQIKYLQERIDREQKRLDDKEARLVAKYARLERTLTLLQNQISALSYYISSS